MSLTNVKCCLPLHTLSSHLLLMMFLSLPFTPPHHKLQKVTEMKCDEMQWNACNVMRCEVGRCEGDNSEDPVLQECTYFDDISIFQNTHHHLCTYSSEAEGKEAKDVTIYVLMMMMSECLLLSRRLMKHRFLSVYLCLESCCFFTLFLRFPRPNVVNATSSYDPIPLSGAQRNMRSWALDSLSSLPKVSKKPASWGVLEAGMMTW